ncbi:MAG: CotH kinase family protein [Paludibacteraceae bacterium]|nr:CotH kinase family protein [Paludibacteraceae bacterium]
MKHIASFIITSFIASMNLFAQDISLLNGTILHNISDKTSVPENVFDDNINTHLEASSAGGRWVGLDLGSAHVITDIEFAPQNENAEKMNLGVFEGANSADFTDAIPILMIKETCANGEMNHHAINCTRGFRYLRYVSPYNGYCRVAEIKFYGYESTGNDSVLYQATNLPTVVIHTENSKDVVTKAEYLKGIASFISENGTKLHSDSLQIKGRGNASWGFPKKPYRIKLNNKKKLLGSPCKAKNWTLLSNYGDKSLMRNLLAFDISKKFEMEYTPAGQPVDLFLNGEYKGNYQLCDHLEVKKNRVEVEEFEDDSIIDNITGGYLIEIDANYSAETVWFNSKKGNPVVVKYPKDDEITQEQLDYIKNHFNTMEDALFSENYTDSASGYKKYLDIESFAKHFIIGELSGNTDTYWSVYMYKHRDDDKFYTGPVWDHDLSFKNDNRTHAFLDNPTNYVYAAKGSVAGKMNLFVNKVMSDPEFADTLTHIWSKYRNSGAISEDSLVKFVDEMEILLEESQRLNFMRWDILNKKVHQNFQALGSYDAEVDVVRSYLAPRISWLDDKIGLIADSSSTEEPTFVKNIIVDNGNIILKGYKHNSNVYIYNVQGIPVYSGSHIGYTSYITNLQRGVYIIKICEQDAVFIHKVLINNK